MTVEEFLMPDSVQILGQIRVVTWDIREEKFRQIDIIDFEDLSTRSGAITKVDDVEVGSSITSAINQTYTFSFKADHSVPLNGFFSILLSEDEANGVKITNPYVVSSNCYKI